MAATITQNPDLYPAFVVQHSIVFDVGDDVRVEDSFPGIVVPDRLSRAVLKRKLEYCAGRFCAQEALRRCSPELSEVAIGSGARGEPLWPSGIVGSITHTHGFASVAVARTSEAHAIGLDAERTINEKLAGDVLEQLATPSEVASLVSGTGWSRAEVLTFVFSAKETIFKCLYPEVLRYFDFRDARIVGIETDRGRFAAELLSPLTRSLPIGTRLDGTFARRSDLVFTGMVRTGR